MQSPQSIPDSRPRSFGPHSIPAYAGEMHFAAHGSHPHILQYARGYDVFAARGAHRAARRSSRPKSRPQQLPDHLLRLVNALIVGTSFALTMAIACVLSYFILSCYGVF